MALSLSTHKAFRWNAKFIAGRCYLLIGPSCQCVSTLSFWIKLDVLYNSVLFRSITTAMPTVIIPAQVPFAGQ
jgi:hypothetical protein